MNALKIQGNILKVLPAQSGTSQRTGNAWMSQDYVLQFHVWDGARMPNFFIFRVFGEDRIKSFAIKEGDMVEVSYYPNGHEFDGRWFGENEAVKVEILKRDGQPIAQPQQDGGTGSAPAAAVPTTGEAPQPTPEGTGNANQEGGGDDLPF